MATQSVKDILNTEIPKPSFVLSPSVPAPLPSGVTHTRNGGDDVARTFDRTKGKMAAVGENVPRIYDGKLLLESTPRTNRLKESDDPDDWVKSGVDFVGGQSPFVSGDSRRSVISNTGSANDYIQKQISGNLVGDDLTYSVIAEKKTADQFKITAFNTNTGGRLGKLVFDFTTNEIVGGDGHTKVLTESGPNGNTVVKVTVYSPSENPDNIGGDNAVFRFHPDATGNGRATRFHVAQVEDDANATTPITTGTFSKTRAEDTLTFFSGGRPEWWNKDEMTITGTITNRSIARRNTQVPLNSDNGTIIEFMGESEAPFGLASNSSAGRPTLGNAVPVGKPFTFALSLTADEKRLASDGKTTSSNHGDELLNISELSFGVGFASENILIHDLRAIPQALPLTESERSAGDPVSLETLTA